jgi:hypothetical protein
MPVVRAVPPNQYRLTYVATPDPDGIMSDLDRRLIIDERGVWDSRRLATITWPRIAPLAPILERLGVLPEPGGVRDVTGDPGDRAALIALVTQRMRDFDACITVARAIAEAMPHEEVRYWLGKCRTSRRAVRALRALAGDWRLL